MYYINAADTKIIHIFVIHKKIILCIQGILQNTFLIFKCVQIAENY